MQLYRNLKTGEETFASLWRFMNVRDHNGKMTSPPNYASTVKVAADTVALTTSKSYTKAGSVELYAMA